MSKSSIPTDFSFQSHYIDVLGSKIHYIEEGEGHPILFLHGMPVSSYIWRNIIPTLSALGRCIAPDLIGMGKSDKPDIQYSITDHIKYITEFIQQLGLKQITLVMHGWGSLIGFDYAMHNEKNCQGLVFYEAYLRSSFEENISLPLQEQINHFEGEEDAFDIVMNGSTFVERVLPQGLLRPLSDKEMSNYQVPFLEEGSGRALHQYFTELPRGDGKSVVDKIISDYSEFLTESYLPKLMLYSIPGFITTIATIMWAKDNLPNLEIAEIGEDLHYAQESNPVLMRETISVWLQGLEH